MRPADGATAGTGSRGCVSAFGTWHAHQTIVAQWLSSRWGINGGLWSGVPQMWGKADRKRRGSAGGLASRGMEMFAPWAPAGA